MLSDVIYAKSKKPKSTLSSQPKNVTRRVRTQIFIEASISTRLSILETRQRKREKIYNILFYQQ